MASIPVYNIGGKPCGQIEGEVLKKSIRGSVHILRRPPAIAWDTAILKRACAAGCKHTEVFDVETGASYAASLADFDQYGIPVRRGFGDQVGLPLQRWRIERPGARQLALALEVAS